MSVVPDYIEPNEALACFSQRFALRYGNIHPLFYIGSLADAVSEATGGPIVKVREERERGEGIERGGANEEEGSEGEEGGGKKRK